jgi:hypothetical protein
VKVQGILSEIEIFRQLTSKVACKSVLMINLAYFLPRRHASLTPPEATR